MNPTNTRASRGETAEEWIARAENMLRLIENTAKHAEGSMKANLLMDANELQSKINVAKNELTGRTGGRSCRV
jgi:hypothetical protein